MGMAEDDSDALIVETENVLDTYINAVDGCIWLIRYGLILKDERMPIGLDLDFKNETKKGIIKWYAMFETIWLRDSRPSELHRVKEIVEDLIAYLES
jgi:hypothetical protein